MYLCVFYMHIGAEHQHLPESERNGVRAVSCAKAQMSFCLWACVHCLGRQKWIPASCKWDPESVTLARHTCTDTKAHQYTHIHKHIHTHTRAFYVSLSHTLTHKNKCRVCLSTRHVLASQASPQVYLVTSILVYQLASLTPLRLACLCFIVLPYSQPNVNICSISVLNGAVMAPKVREAGL